MATRTGRIVVTACAIAVIVVVAVMLLISRTDTAKDDATVADSATAQVVRDSSHRLTDPEGAAVTVVEFLDFECEGCRAAHPIVEQLRADYGDRVEFVIRYFPLSGHVNGERAARAVEAAAQQGRLEDMYRTMFETQSEWGERQVPADHVFREFATRLGLDVSAYDAAYDSPDTLERIRVDQRDGRALGVQGTPTFFLNGEQVRLRSRDDLRAAIDAALR